VGRNAHSIRTDESNKFVFVCTLGSDEIFQFTFNSKTGHLASNTPAVFLTKPALGPRHFITSSDNKFVYVLSELTGTVTTFSLNSDTGLLTEVSSTSGLPPESKLAPGAPRGPVGAPGGPPPRNTDNDIWAADLHLTPNGKFLYMTERTSNSLATFSVDGASGKLIFLGSTPTENQPRGFAIDPKGRFLVVSGEKSDTISAYAIDEASGAVKLIGKYPAGTGVRFWHEADIPKRCCEVRDRVQSGGRAFPLLTHNGPATSASFSQESRQTGLYSCQLGVHQSRFEVIESWPPKTRFSSRAAESAESPPCRRCGSAASPPSYSSRPRPSVRWGPAFRSAATRRASCGRLASAMRWRASRIIRRDETIAPGTTVIVSTTRH
jgi:hypothetical protein